MFESDDVAAEAPHAIAQEAQSVIAKISRMGDNGDRPATDNVSVQKLAWRLQSTRSLCSLTRVEDLLTS